MGGETLSRLANLKNVTLDFSGCTQLNSLDNLLQPLQEMKGLTNLTLLSPEGANIAKKEKAAPKPTPAPKPKPKAKQEFTSITARQTWAKSNKQPKKAAKQEEDVDDDDWE